MPDQDILTLNDLLDAAAGFRRPGGLHTPQALLSYPELRGQVLRVAAGLHAAGIRPGDCVVILLRNGIPFVTAYFALARLGAVAVPVNFMVQRPDDLAALLQDCRALAAVTQEEFLPGLRAAALRTPSLRRLWVTDHHDTGGPQPEHRPFAELTRSEAGLPSSVVSPDDLAAVLYTAGTTGSPKGVMLTHRNLVTNCTAAAAHMRLRRDDVFLCILPMFHAFAWTANVLVPMSASLKIAVAPAVTPAKPWLKLMARHGVTIFTGIPQLFAVLAREAKGLRGLFLRWRPFRRVRLGICGAAPLSPATARLFESRLRVPICEGYGLTETSPIAAINPPESRRLGTVGLPIPGVRLQIRDEAGRTLPPQRDGEVFIQGDCVMLGYRNQPEATAAALDAEGWLRTGDVGNIDADGYLTIKDRLKDMIIVKGLKVYSAQVEAALLEHPAVAEAAVVGVPDETGDETIQAFVVLRPGVPADRGALLSHCRSRLDNYKRPRDVEILSELPKNTLQKTLKRALRQKVLSRRPQP